MASSALPVLADDPSLFPGRGRFERLSLNYHEIKAGASKPFSVLHISDTHLTAAYPDEGEWERKIAERRIRTFGGRQEEALRDSIAWAKIHTDYIVHTGDLIDFQSRANFDLVKKYYGEGGAAMLGCLGNHEHLATMNTTAARWGRLERTASPCRRRPSPTCSRTRTRSRTTSPPPW